MARNHLAGPFAEPSPSTPVDAYLARLSANLPGPRTARQVALEEVRDGLAEAIAKRIEAGLPRSLAAREAVAELGSPDTLARAFAPELAIRHARRMLLGLLLTGPLVGACWLLLLAPSAWPPHPESVWRAIPVLPLVGVAVTAAVATLATTGSLIRWLPEASPRLALRATIGVAAATLLADLTVLSTFAARAVATPWHFSPALAAVAIFGSMIRIASTCAVVRTSRRTRRRLQPTPQGDQLPR